MKFAIIGATGNVGRKTIDILEKSKLDIEQLHLVASKNSSGKKIKFKGKELIVVSLDNYNFEKADITFFAAGSSIAEKYAKDASKKTIVIDNSKYFRMDKNVPLVVPEVNSEDIKKHKNIIANPNCSTIQMVLALKPLHKNFNIKRVVVSTYQAVSGNIHFDCNKNIPIKKKCYLFELFKQCPCFVVVSFTGRKPSCFLFAEGGAASDKNHYMAVGRL